METIVEVLSDEVIIKVLSPPCGMETKHLFRLEVSINHFGEFLF